MGHHIKLFHFILETNYKKQLNFSSANFISRMSYFRVLFLYMYTYTYSNFICLFYRYSFIHQIYSAHIVAFSAVTSSKMNYTLQMKMFSNLDIIEIRIGETKNFE